MASAMRPTVRDAEYSSSLDSMADTTIHADFERLRRSMDTVFEIQESTLKSMFDAIRESRDEFRQAYHEFQEGFRQDFREFRAGIKQKSEIESYSQRSSSPLIPSVVFAGDGKADSRIDEIATNRVEVGSEKKSEVAQVTNTAPQVFDPMPLRRKLRQNLRKKKSHNQQNQKKRKSHKTYMFKYKQTKEFLTCVAVATCGFDYKGRMQSNMELLAVSDVILVWFLSQMSKKKLHNELIQKVDNNDEHKGWSNHLVSTRKYHLIIPLDSEWNMPLEDDVFDLQTHLLHGLIHSNGFGHLICINGMEGGSKYFCGREIVDLWDRICSTLGARMVTVEDMSKKRSLELRLLYGVAYGHSWFGRWGYKFCRGSYGVTKTDYENAIELLGSLELDQIEFDFSEHKQSKEIKQIFRYYREMSEGNLHTFKDLLRFMLIIKSHAPQTSKRPAAPLSAYFPHQKRSNRLFLKKSDVVESEKSQRDKSYSIVAANLGSRWPVRRLEFAAEVIVKSLKEMKALNQKGMTRQDVRDAARLHIGDTGLLDYVLKSMNNVVVGNVLVRRYVDPVTRTLHYTIQELDDTTKLIEPKKEVVLDPIPLRIFTELKPGADVYGDLLLLYTSLLHKEYECNGCSMGRRDDNNRVWDPGGRVLFLQTLRSRFFEKGRFDTVFTVFTVLQ